MSLHEMLHRIKSAQFCKCTTKKPVFNDTMFPPIVLNKYAPLQSFGWSTPGQCAWIAEFGNNIVNKCAEEIRAAGYKVVVK